MNKKVEKENSIERYIFNGNFEGIKEFEEEDRLVRNTMSPLYKDRIDALCGYSRNCFKMFCKDYNLAYDSSRLINPSLSRTLKPEFMLTKFVCDFNTGAWHLGIQLNISEFESLMYKGNGIINEMSEAILVSYHLHEWFHCQDKFMYTVSKKGSNINILSCQSGVQIKTTKNINSQFQEIQFTTDQLENIKNYLLGQQKHISTHEKNLLDSIKLRFSNADPLPLIDLLSNGPNASISYPEKKHHFSKVTLNESLKEFLSVISLPYTDAVKFNVLKEAGALHEFSTSKIIKYYHSLNCEDQVEFVQACYNAGRYGIRPLVVFFRKKIPKILPTDIVTMRVFEMSADYES
ncbi:MAG: hypothetical protein OHK0017_13660 [Patescibacteria group bacterium]